MQRIALHNERGFATLIALLMVGMLTLLGIAALSTSDDEVNIAGNELQETRAFYAAEAGLEAAAAALQTEYDSTGVPPTIMPTGTQEVNRCLVTYSTSDNGAAQQQVLSSGSLVGLHALVKSFTIASTAVGSSIGTGRVDMEQTFETALVPIFQWAVFYEEDLWVEPVFDMTIDGRVHCNNDMFIRSAGAGKDFLFTDRVSCAGDITHGFPWVGSSGDVIFTDELGNEVSMCQGGTWIDSHHANWYDTASALWGGMVRDQAFGQEALNLPLTSGDPYRLIQRGAGNPDSKEHEAGLKILDGVVYSKVGGVWQDVTAAMPADAIVCDATTTFFDAKEKQWIRNTQIDVDELVNSGYFPSNGIIYISDQRNRTTATYGEVDNATMLFNGDDLDGNPMTVVCENPVYVQGDFNTDDKQPASVMSDALTFLSNNWDPDKAREKDAFGRLYSDRWSDVYYAKKNASKTTVNLSFITGDTEADVGSRNHGGGLENFPRFIENWSGTEFKIRGSMIELFHSREATGTYTYAKYFTAPTRNWGFDTDLLDPNKLPPGTPCVRVFQRTGWKQQHVGAY